MTQIAIGVLLLIVGLGGVFLPMIQERRTEKRKQAMMNNVSAPRTPHTYSDPFASEPSDSMSMSSDEDIWSPTSTYSEPNDENSNSDNGSKTGLRLKM